MSDNDRTSTRIIARAAAEGHCTRHVEFESSCLWCGISREALERASGSPTSPSIGAPVMVDGVLYTQKRIREIVHERHLMAMEIRDLERRLERADRHLRLRTSALTRLIAKKGPRFEAGGHVTIAQPTLPSERPVPSPPVPEDSGRPPRPGWARARARGHGW